MGLTNLFEAQCSRFFYNFNRFVMPAIFVLTDRLLYPLLCMHAWSSNAEFPDSGIFELGHIPGSKCKVCGEYMEQSQTNGAERTLCDLVFKFVNLVYQVDWGNHGHGLAAIILQVISLAQAMLSSGRSSSMYPV